MNAFLLSERDQQILRALISREQHRHQGPYQNRPPDDPLSVSPEVYVVLTPVGGIPPLTYVGTGTAFPGGVYPSLGTGTSTGSEVGFLDSPGQADCSVYFILDTNKFVPELRPTGLTLTVYNLSTSAIPGGTFIPVKRDKYGSWLADDDASKASGPPLLPDNLCWQSNTCVQFKQVYSGLGTGTGSSSYINVVTKLTAEVMCINTKLGVATLTCTDNPTNCCPTCCCVCNPNNQNVCLAFSNGTGQAACFNGFSVSLSPIDQLCAQNLANGGSGAYLYGYDVSHGGGTKAPRCVPPCPSSSTYTSAYYLVCPKTGTKDWRSIMLQFKFLCVSGGNSAVITNSPTQNVSDATTIPSSGSCAPTWTLKYKAVPLYSYGPTQSQIGTIDVTATCGGCSCGVTAVGKGNSGSTAPLNSTAIPSVTVTGGALLVVNVATNSANSVSCTFNGVSMTLDNSAVGGGSASNVYTFSLSPGSTTTGNIVATLSSGFGDMGMDAVEVQGLSANVKDQGNSGTGSSSAPSTGSVTLSNTCDYVNAAFMYSPNSSPTYSGGFTNGGQDRTFGQFGFQHTLTEGFLVNSATGTFTASLSAPASPTNWAGAITAYK